MILAQKSFATGMDLLSDDSQVANDGYVWAVNCRSRLGYLEPNKKHEKITIPDGILQGIVTVNNVIVIFVSGKAYWQTDGDTGWVQIPNFQMDAFVYQYWTQSVPASTFNFPKSLNSSGSIYDTMSSKPDFKISGTPAGVVVQDGINQPWVIIFNETNITLVARECKKFSDWQNVSATANDREYVPIGKQMMFFNQTLYIVSRDGKSVYRSITGRPLDFMINVDTNGNKQGSELLGGAATVSFAFDFDPITCLTTIDLPDSFVYGTKKFTRIVTADYTNTIFGEPTFRETSKLRSGIVNQYSFGESLGDYVYISSDGVKSFNAVQQLKFKGGNSIFSLQLAKLLKNQRTGKAIKQINCNIVNFDNYLMCCLDTYWGNMIAVYDTLRGNWTSLDVTRVSRVKQFAIVETETDDKLYAITKTNDLYRMFTGATREMGELRVKSFIAQATDTEHKSTYLRPMFNGGTYDGECLVREFVDEKETLDNYTRKPLNVQLGGVRFDYPGPIIPSTEQRIENPSFPLTKGLSGKKLTFVIQWTNDAQLVEFMLTTDEAQADASQRDKMNAYAN